MPSLFRAELSRLPEAVLKKLPGPSPTAFDLKRMARRPMLVEGLTREQARAEQRRLLAAGHVVEVVADEWLKLPRERRCRRADIEADALVIPDELGGERRIAWDAVRVIAVGVVPKIDRVAVEEVDFDHDGDAFTETVSRGKRAEGLQMTLVTSDPVRRYVVDPERFDFSALGDRERIRERDNLALWLPNLVAHAPRVTLDPATQAFLETGRPQRYRSSKAMDRIVAWSLWRYHGPGASLDGEIDIRTEPFVEDGSDLTFTERARARSADRVIASFGEDQRRYAAKQRPTRTVEVVFGAALAALVVTYELAPDDMSWAMVGVMFLALLAVGCGLGWYFVLKED